MRPRDDAAGWHMPCRFRDRTALAAWEASPERQWWLRSAQGPAEIMRTERRTGIEGWFDEPVAGEVVTSSAPRSAPPRWEQATTIWLVFFRLSLLTTVTPGELLGRCPWSPGSRSPPSS